MEINVINPRKYSYSFRLGPRDCYRVKTGRCSLMYSLDEYQTIKSAEKNHSWDTPMESSIDYCRELANEIEQWRNDSDSRTGINAQLNRCGHISFSDGQHRTCIAKQLGYDELVIAKLTLTGLVKCGACSSKEREKNMRFSQKIINKYKRIKQGNFPPNPFIDDELFQNDSKT